MADQTWNPDGIFGALDKLHKPLDTLSYIMTPEQQKTVDLEDKGAPEGIGGARPPGWDDHGEGQPVGAVQQVGDGPLALGRPAGNYYGDYLPHGLSTPIGETPGYPEAGRSAYRAGLDDQLTIGAANYNAAYGYKPGDPFFVTPALAKFMAMQESGGDDDRSQKAFRTDPLQANAYRDDWDDKKARYGMSPGQTMTPMASITGGLGWLHQKAEDMARKHPGTDVTMIDALRAYNGNTKIDVNGLPHNQNYATSILNRAGYGYGGRQK